MRILKYAVILLFSLSMMSCGEDDDKKVDNTNPTITLNSPTSVITINPGRLLNVNAVLSDNVKLKEYEVRISSVGTKATKGVYEFYFSSYTDLDAYGNALPVIEGEKSVDLNFDIAIMDYARVGDYVFSISARDQAGNGHEETVYFEISRP